MKLIITIPAYNEEKSLGQVIDSIKPVLKELKEETQILVVDDGSTDKTSKVAKEHDAIVVSHQINQGLASAFRTAVKKSLDLGADIIINFDADGQYLAKEIPLLLNEIKKGNDLVLGSRFKGTIEQMPLMKRLGNILFSRVISKIVNYKVSDCQTGFRAYNRKVAENIKLISNFTYTQEQIIKAVHAGFKIKEVPVYFAKREGESRLMKNPFDYAIKAWINIFRIYRDYDPIKFFGKIGLSFFSIGFIIGLFLVYKFIKTGIIGHIPLTILSLLFIIIGIQIIIFGFLADMRG
ncbi:glycosyltransferase family 2 protein [Candidatus Woesearchaeota archaeon]|nr:glycosyltransferase family 2 protein [Candidatus Woesearchaeota archaeon]